MKHLITKKLFIILFVVLSLFVLAFINNRSAIGDEFGTIWIASQHDPGFIISKVQQTDIHPPTYYLILHYWGKLLDYSDTTMRLLSWVLIMFSAFLIFKIMPFFLKEENRKYKAEILCLTLSSPAIWYMALYARYYAFGLCISLLSFYFYFQWNKIGNRRDYFLWIIFTVALFYIHYFISFTVLACQVLYNMFNKKGSSKDLIKTTLIPIILILLLSTPVLWWSLKPLLINQSSSFYVTKSVFLPETLSAWKGLPLFLAGNILSMLGGAIVFPWTFWITLPLVLIVIYFLFFDLRYRRILLKKDFLILVVIPFLLLICLMAFYLPITGYFLGIYRLPHITVFFLVFIFTTVFVTDNKYRKVGFFILIFVNLYSISVLTLNLSSNIQTPPLNEMGGFISKRVDREQSTVVINPFEHGWGQAILRYLPNQMEAILVKDNNEYLSSDSCISILSNKHFVNVWIIRPNRFPQSSEKIKFWLTENDYASKDSISFQSQSSINLFFKESVYEDSIS